MVDNLIMATYIVVSTCDCLDTTICAIAGCIQSSKYINLKVELFNNLGQTTIIDVKARVVKARIVLL
jgi:hypothetical protein